MGFLTRLLAGLTAAAALGTGLAGTANAVDVTGAAGTTKSVVKLTADDTNNLPDHIVNGSFDYPSVPSWTGLAGSGSNKFNKGKRFATINPGTGKYGSGCAMSTTGRAIPNWNRSSFAWSSTQGDTHYSGGMSCEAGNVELNYDSVHHNQFAELTADQQGTAIYQDVKVTPGTMMKWSLKHSSATSAYVDKMQVMIGEPYKETAQEATRITSENGNKVGEKMTTISTPTTSDRADNKKWDTRISCPTGSPRYVSPSNPSRPRNGIPAMILTISNSPVPTSLLMTRIRPMRPVRFRRTSTARRTPPSPPNRRPPET